MPPGIPIAASSCQLEPSSRRILWQMEVTDVIKPLYLRSAFLDRSPPRSRRYVAVFYCGDFWASNLTYLEFKGNEVCLTRLGDIITAKTKLERPHRRDVHLLNYNAPLPESVVSDLLSVSGEGLRSLLIAHLEAPFPDGWKDRNQWVVRNMSQFKLDGQLALLPRRPPDDYQLLSCLKSGWDDYPHRLVALCLRSYVRPWLPPAWHEIERMLPNSSRRGLARLLYAYQNLGEL